MLRRRDGLVMLVLVGLLVAAGCGGSSRQATVKGEVTLDGQPVGPGSISFLPEEGTESRKAAAAIENGRYEIPAEVGPSPGKFRVEITWSKKTGRTVPSADPGMTIEETREAMPAKYNTESTLIREITPGENVLNFQLQR